jgi:large repetitive protein
LSGGGTATITYADASTPSTVFFSTFATAAAGKGKKTLALASSPAVTGVSPLAPEAPTVTDMSPGPDSLTVDFTAPASPETITGYTAACGSSSNTAPSPATSITIFDLNGGTSYSCTLFATDATGNGFIAPWSGIPDGVGGL